MLESALIMARLAYCVAIYLLGIANINETSANGELVYNRQAFFTGVMGLNLKGMLKFHVDLD